MCLVTRREILSKYLGFHVLDPGTPLSEDGFDVRVHQPGEHLDHRQMAWPFVATKPRSVYSGRATIATS